MSIALMTFIISLGIIFLLYFWDHNFFIYKKVYHDMKNHFYTVGELGWDDYKRHGIISYNRIYPLTGKESKYNEVIFFKHDNCTLVADKIYIGSGFNFFSFFASYYSSKFLKLRDNFEKEFDDEQELRAYEEMIVNALENNLDDMENDDETPYMEDGDEASQFAHKRLKVRRKSFKFLN